jgi:DNA-nicking Smr family endonuclease
MSPKREQEDAALFREATRDVKPLASEQRAADPRRPAPRARFTRAERGAILEESLHVAPEEVAALSGEALTYLRPGVQPSVLGKLRRGHYRVQAELDLHGLTVSQAKAVLREFLAAAHERGASCVRIIHGKGLRSGPRGPVLKHAVSVILRRTGHVLAFVSARAVDGGTGAVYVLMGERAAPA